MLDTVLVKMGCWLYQMEMQTMQAARSRARRGGCSPGWLERDSGAVRDSVHHRKARLTLSILQKVPERGQEIGAAWIWGCRASVAHHPVSPDAIKDLAH